MGTFCPGGILPGGGHTSKWEHFGHLGYNKTLYSGCAGSVLTVPEGAFGPVHVHMGTFQTLGYSNGMFKCAQKWIFTKTMLLNDPRSWKQIRLTENPLSCNIGQFHVNTPIASAILDNVHLGSIIEERKIPPQPCNWPCKHQKGVLSTHGCRYKSVRMDRHLKDNHTELSQA